jgi:hypothetical protein
LIATTHEEHRPLKPGRRLHDRLAAHETNNPTLGARADVSNLLLLIDDDLRETAETMGVIDGFLAESLRLLESRDVTPSSLLRLAADEDLMEQIDRLQETLATLRRRFGALATTIR